MTTKVGSHYRQHDINLRNWLAAGNTRTLLDRPQAVQHV